MNELQRQKAVEALEEKKAKEHKQFRAMLYHLYAYTRLHCEGVLLPYQVLYDLEKQVYEGTFKEVFPNKFYPAPAAKRSTVYSAPEFKGDYKKVTKPDGMPDFRLDPDYNKESIAYHKRIDAEKMPLDKWDYWYARFLLPYDLESFSDFDFWGELPKNEEEKQVVNSIRKACLEAWYGCKAHPENYNFEPVPRLEEHKTIYDVDYSYI